MKTGPTPWDRWAHFVRTNGGWRNTLRIAWRKLRRCGPGDTLRAVVTHGSPTPRWPARRYRRFIKLHERPLDEAARQALLAALPERPRLRLLALATLPSDLPRGGGRRGSRPPRTWIEGLRSIQQQSYPDWDCAVVAEAGAFDLVQAAIAQVATSSGRESRLVAVSADAGRGLERLNLDAAAGAQWIARVDIRDRLAKDALLHVAEAVLQTPDLDLLYTDEDSLDRRGRRRLPRFKPSWSPETLRAYPYIGDLFFIRQPLWQTLGGYDPAMAPAECYDLALRAEEQARQVMRLPRVLYHRVRPFDEHVTAAENHARHAALRRCDETADIECITAGRTACVERGAALPWVHLRYRHAATPRVSVIVPTRDHPRDLERCLSSLRERTTYAAYEVLIADNGTTDPDALTVQEQALEDPRFRRLNLDGPFNFSLINNRAVDHTEGEVLVFLNNDTEVLSGDWLERMLGQALRPAIGAVGARLTYPDGTVQHAGVAGIGPGPTHAFQGLAAHYPHPRLQLDGNWAAVTAACLMLERTKFDRVGGFDKAFPVAYNDVDLCLHLAHSGFRNVLVARARLMHREFATRGSDRTSPLKRQRLEEARERLYRKWPWFADDPWYHPNLSDGFPDFLPRH